MPSIFFRQQLHGHVRVMGQSPLRSRSAPLGLSSLSPAKSKKVCEANFVLECLAWCSEQALACPVKVVALTIIFPEDPGGHADGPSSIWALREIQLLEGIRDARTAVYLCQLTGADFKRPLSSLRLTNFRARLFAGWPRLVSSNKKLVYEGSLPTSCYCGRAHSPMFGTTDFDDFIASTHSVSKSGTFLSWTTLWRRGPTPLGVGERQTSHF